MQPHTSVEIPCRWVRGVSGYGGRDWLALRIWWGDLEARIISRSCVGVEISCRWIRGVSCFGREDWLA
jgi:hypothetical protein